MSTRHNTAGQDVPPKFQGWALLFIRRGAPVTGRASHLIATIPGDTLWNRGEPACKSANRFGHSSIYDTPEECRLWEFRDLEDFNVCPVCQRIAEKAGYTATEKADKP